MNIKICGITTLDDALAAVEAGADMLGFNFYPPSPRCIEPAACAAMIAALRAHGAPTTMVGVFVNMPPDRVAAILDECGLDLAQLSGDEPPSDLVMLGERAFKGIRPSDAAEAVALAARYVVRSAPPVLLVDASVRRRAVRRHRAGGRLGCRGRSRRRSSHPAGGRPAPRKRRGRHRRRSSRGAWMWHPAWNRARGGRTRRRCGIS